MIVNLLMVIVAGKGLKMSQFGRFRFRELVIISIMLIQFLNVLSHFTGQIKIVLRMGEEVLIMMIVRLGKGKVKWVSFFVQIKMEIKKW